MKKQFFPTLATALLLAVLVADNKAGCGRSGMQGHVYEVRGNQMPSPDMPPPQPRGIKTKLYIHELTNISQVTRRGTSAFYTSVPTRLVREVETSDDGSFQVELAPGWYSLFVKKDELFYSSMFDEKNNIHPVEVKKGEVAKVEFRVNYNAVY